MMDYELPTEFDIIIIGTGVIESIISAAASRIGKRVLHIDSNNYYGGLWASFNLDAIQKLVSSEPPSIEGLGNSFFSLKNFTIEWHIPEETPPESNEWSRTRLLKESRKFNLDLTPKLQFARGDFVELLISSNIARYSEYRSVSRVLTWLNGQLETVPCSRSDVFANNKVTVIEKRMLMKLFLALDSGDQEYPNYENKSFRAFLSDKKLTPNLIHYVLYAIAMSTDETPCLQGIQNTKRFLDSLGRFGKTPFLFSMYGSGEITQAFCRLSAVFGGIYALSQPLKGLILNGDNFEGITCGKQEIKAEFLVMGAEKAPPEFIKQHPQSYIARAILITDKSIMDSEKEHLTLLLYPPEGDKNSCVVIELGCLTGTCPKDLFVVHLVSRQIEGPQIDFKHIIQNLFGSEKAKILWSCYFSIPDSNDLDLRCETPKNVLLCPGPDIDLDYDYAVKNAKTIFMDIFPDCEFLPRAPDPEEIIIEGEPTEDQSNVDLKAETVKPEE
ncbi:rab proteins geranylgeranyltransferase component A 2 [Tribolium madens]|uniref:rab proteins geranylgeranyltransferase component A 2 n=1 Tax=Tribolium madens TaxID=41895 RepID=UPI001CF76211|nr:rab proteins geranylgeranyltransferase component A 2 [Tribolium madens]